MRSSWSIHSNTWSWPIRWRGGIFGVAADGGGGRAPLVWQPPDQLRQPLADVLQNRREYLPEGFDKAS